MHEMMELSWDARSARMLTSSQSLRLTGLIGTAASQTEFLERRNCSDPGVLRRIALLLAPYCRPIEMPGQMVVATP